jgi:hypothetical protein
MFFILCWTEGAAAPSRWRPLNIQVELAQAPRERDARVALDRNLRPGARLARSVLEGQTLAIYHFAGRDHAIPALASCS